ncbi:hypothetical protein MGN70_009789 [Eutypa lata]|uniref:Uncharacterized protein n=1 Tax=Eutypa lata (strain UCR-EL1) TaxID=1287681 RepID=M7SRS8_EUTLA|nr:hypothetical protein UCREL1_6068 [Eutypa lata UCREL1]KAI1248589.1 hypothetical protein MGN70_009789 [Eutypa lata]
MDHSRTGHSTSNLRSLTGKHRGLAVFALAAAGLAAVGVQYKRTALRRNEQAQRDYAENRYVSVDRSGGGI